MVVFATAKTRTCIFLNTLIHSLNAAIVLELCSGHSFCRTFYANALVTKFGTATSVIGTIQSDKDFVQCIVS